MVALLGEGRGGALRRRDGIGPRGRGLVAEQQRRPGTLEVPADIGRQEAQEQVCPDPVLAPVEDRPDREVVALERPEVALDRGQALVRLDDRRRVEPLGPTLVRTTYSPSRAASAAIASVRRRYAKTPSAMSSSKCLAIFFAFTTRPARRPIAAAVRRRPRSTAAATCASASSVAARSASRLRARSAARTGLRQTTRRSPGNSGLVISARSRSSNNPSWRSPASTSRRIAGARRQLTQPIRRSP